MDSKIYPVEPGQCSYFRSIADNQPIKIDITRFLNAIKRQQLYNLVTKIRNEKDKKKRNKLKLKLPAICPAATLSHSHSISNLVSLSGIISIDIDDCGDARSLQSRLYDDDFVYCMFISLGGKGLKVLFKADYTYTTFLQTYLAIGQYFLEKYDISINDKCKNINRLTFISSDANLFIRKNSKIFSGKIVPIKENKPLKLPVLIENNKTLTEILIDKIEILKIDITPDYSDWLKIAFALVAEFGINGIGYFHRISQFYPQYDAFECEKKYRNCYKTGSRSITIKSLYSIAKDYGITFKAPS